MNRKDTESTKNTRGKETGDEHAPGEAGAVEGHGRRTAPAPRGCVSGGRSRDYFFGLGVTGLSVGEGGAAPLAPGPS